MNSALVSHQHRYMYDQQASYQTCTYRCHFSWPSLMIGHLVQSRVVHCALRHSDRINLQTENKEIVYKAKSIKCPSTGIKLQFNPYLP